MINRTNFDDVSEADLRDVIEAEKPEGVDIEYKRDPYGGSDADKKEALKDITSFANTNGGHLIIGMDETGGIPNAMVGVAESETLIQRLESLMRDGVEPRLVGVRTRPIPLEHGGAVIVVRIPRSWNPPHRVRTGNSNRFWVRNSSGAHEANVEELRVLFNLTADAQARIRKFRNDRITEVVSGKGSELVAEGAVLFAHLIPLSAFAQATTIDVGKIMENQYSFRPMGQGLGITPKFNLDGVVNVRGDKEHTSGYTQIFRSGIVEATKADVMDKWGGVQCVRTASIVQVVEEVPKFLKGLELLDVSPPIILMVSYQGVGGAKLKVGDVALDRIQAFPRIDPLFLPKVLFDNFGTPEEYQRAMKPICDALWNAAGFGQCRFFDGVGNWSPPRQ
jgi:hypothetical protein